jgi:hypothetical protein
MSDNQASSIAILLVEPDDDVRPLLVENLTSTLREKLCNINIVLT